MLGNHHTTELHSHPYMKPLIRLEFILACGGMVKSNLAIFPGTKPVTPTVSSLSYDASSSHANFLNTPGFAPLRCQEPCFTSMGTQHKGWPDQGRRASGQQGQVSAPHTQAQFTCHYAPLPRGSFHVFKPSSKL